MALMNTSRYQSYSKSSLNNTVTGQKLPNSGTASTQKGSSSTAVSGMDSDKLSSMIQKGYDQVTTKIHKDFKPKGNSAYQSALKQTNQAFDKYKMEDYASAVYDQIKQNRSQKGKTGPLSEAEVNIAVGQVSKNVRQNFENQMIKGMKSTIAPNLKGSGRGSLMDFMA